MLFEIVTVSLMGSIALKAYSKKRGLETNDSGKIQRIISLSGLNVKDGKDTLTTQLIRKKQHEWGWEYKYRIPLGRSFEDYVNKKSILEDGINNRRQRITFNDLKDLQLDSSFIDSLKSLWSKKLTGRKELELSFDGLLTLRVYDEPLPQMVSFQAGEGWKIPVGITREKNEFKFHDFEKVPHKIVGGSSRYGKSVFLNSIIISLLQTKPEHVKFYLIDLKGGIEFCDYENIKQVQSIAYEPHEALETLQMAYDRMRDVQSKLRMMGKKSVLEARIPTRHFVIIDEAGELSESEGAITKEEKQIKIQCQALMSQISRLGAALGFRQILCTQYPVGNIIPRQCKQNSDAKLCFRVQSEVASRVVLDSGGAEQLPQIRGRAIYQTADKREIVQTPLITSEIIKKTIAPYIVEKTIVNDKPVKDNVFRFIPMEKEEEIEKTFRKRRENIVTFEEV